MTIDKILVSGGTHGNELTGVSIVKHWRSIALQLDLDKYDFSVESRLMNKEAIKQRKRFCDEDLNRQFSHALLEMYAGKTTAVHEINLAQQLNETLGPKTSPRFDLVVDFHNTTSNLGACLILLTKSEFEIQMARYVNSVMPEANILLENHVAYADFPYLCTLGKHGVMLEIGAQAHGVNSASVYNAGLKLLMTVLDFCDAWNKGPLPETEQAPAFKLTGDVHYPDNGKTGAMIHPNLFAKDFHALEKGDPCFMTLQGDTLIWEGDKTYPHFIGEVAYQHLGLAFSTAEKILL